MKCPMGERVVEMFVNWRAVTADFGCGLAGTMGNW